MDHFTTSTFHAVDYAKPARFVLYGVIYGTSDGA